MTAKIQFKENEMREAIVHIRRCAKELRETARQMANVSNMIQQGALIGEGGTQFQTVIKSSLNSKIEDIAQKLEEKARFAEVELEQLLKAASQLR